MNTKKDFLKTGIICLAVFVLGALLDAFTKVKSFIGTFGFFVELMGFVGIAYWVVLKYSTISKNSNRCILSIIYIIVGLLIYMIANFLNITAVSFYTAIFMIGNAIALIANIIYTLDELETELSMPNEQSEESKKDIKMI